MKIKVYNTIDEIEQDKIKCAINKNTKYLLRRSQKIRDEVCKHLKMQKVPIMINNTNNGCAHTKTRKITIPTFITQYGDDYIIYTICHEVCHIFCGPRAHHGYLFKNTERKTLMNLYKIEIIYNRAYPKVLIKNGKEVYVNLREKMRREE